jgi:hypothetical protein
MVVPNWRPWSDIANKLRECSLWYNTVVKPAVSIILSNRDWRCMASEAWPGALPNVTVVGGMFQQLDCLLG